MTLSLLRVTSFVTWVLLSPSLQQRVTEGSSEKGEGGKEGDEWFGDATASSGDSDLGLSAVVQNLAKQVAELNNKQSREWTRLRRAERRDKSARHDIDVMHADITQLRQHVLEINSRLDTLHDLTSDLQLEVTKVTHQGHQHGRMREEIRKTRHSQHSMEDAVAELKKNVTRMDAWKNSAQDRLNTLLSWRKDLLESQGNFLAKMDHLQVKTQTLSEGSQTQPSLLASNNGQVFEKDSERQQQAKNPSGQPGGKPSEIPGKAFGNSQSRPQRDQSLDNGEEHVATPYDDEFQNDTDISGDGEEEEVKDEEYLGSGESDEFFIINEEVDDEEEEAHPHDKTSPEREKMKKKKTKTITPTPLTTSTVTTLINPSPTLSTSPVPPCPTTADFSLLHQRVEELNARLENSTPSEHVLSSLNNRTEVLESALAARDRELERVKERVADLGVTVSRVSGQLESLGVGDAVEKLLRGSLVNFTGNVVTLEQWRVASQQMVNASDHTRRRLAELAQRVREQGEVTSQLWMTSEEHGAASRRQYRALQSHVIRLNNTLQDLRDEIHAGTGAVAASAKPHSKRPTSRRISSSIPSSKQRHQEATLRSRVEDLDLRLVHTDTRLSHLETQVLNASLQSCRKSNSDLYQDANLLRVDQQLTDAQHELVTLKDTVKRLDLGLYRLHGNSKAVQEALRKVKGQVNEVMPMAGAVQGLKSEVDNLLFQTPVDCEDYYQRGYRRSGAYVIYPRGAAHSLKVRCVMRLNDDEYDDDDDDDGGGGDKKKEEDRKKGRDGSGRGRRGRREWKEGGGGWTVIHQRSSGKVNFTRGWADYSRGFGDPPDSDYWLGNEPLHLLTAHRNYTLLVTLTDVFDGRWHALYRPCSVGGERDGYRLRLGRYRGNATDTLRYASGVTFSTYDRDTDASSSPCARYNGGGWWYSHCQTSNLNGPYDVGMIWFHREWRDWLHLREAAMMIKPLAT